MSMDQITRFSTFRNQNWMRLGIVLKGSNIKGKIILLVPIMTDLLLKVSIFFILEWSEL